MIFSNSPATFESEKERNFYYKVFAGYYFNEMVDGYELRLKQFCQMINSCTRKGLGTTPFNINLDPKNTHISFDNHLYLFDQIKTDRGEFADILIQDYSNRLLIAIEAKMHSNWSHEKDIVSNQKRHEQLGSLLTSVKIIPILLLSEFRWNHAMKKETYQNSNYLRFITNPDCRFRVIFWEEIMGIIVNPEVKNFMQSQLCRYADRFTYKATNDWFTQVTHS